MLDLETREETPVPDRTTRRAALWATVVAVPVAVLVGFLAFTQVLRPAQPAAAPTTAAPSARAAVPDTPVPMAAPALSARAAQVCQAVTSALPGTLRDLPARQVTAGPRQNAAWGEPPITLACGVAQPAMCATLDGGAGCVPLDAELLNMNEVCWYARQDPAGPVFTTLDREVPVRVTVPTGYAQAAQWANEFSDAVAAASRKRTTGVPSGCR
ncbi:uncharacterized protein DUF3515 [Krasilnikovia cinnamomea]|uniref:Uncharacterized protein DUF3515 n=1 Tax=Krasilnikovia cinnamomea TaxID=349313 RepID=A0A4Q7ZHE9_9ACTN|nr:DUF3515 family protein [Krasilnikovia cinnamomea]RZU49811.1 uncharacterized protein DUF3515 [Krasilnikovia cinnamomea]